MPAKANDLHDELKLLLLFFLLHLYLVFRFSAVIDPIALTDFLPLHLSSFTFTVYFLINDKLKKKKNLPDFVEAFSKFAWIFVWKTTWTVDFSYQWRHMCNDCLSCSMHFKRRWLWQNAVITASQHVSAHIYEKTAVIAKNHKILCDNLCNAKSTTFWRAFINVFRKTGPYWEEMMRNWCTNYSY